MFQREMKVNFKSFLIWLLVLIGIFSVVFLIYPSIATSENMELLDKIMEIFPEELLKAFNMDISSIGSAYGWLKSEGFVFILLITGCYAAVLGSNILLKEESDKTIEYLNSLPVKRSTIVIHKVLCGLTYITLLVVFLGIFNFIGLSLSGDFDKTQYLLLSITPLFSSYALFFIGMFLSTFVRKTKKMIGISLGIVFLSYVFNVLSSLSETTKFLQYISIFTLADIRNVILTNSINPMMIMVSLLLSAVFFLLTLFRYQKKEFL